MKLLIIGPRQSPDSKASRIRRTLQEMATERYVTLTPRTGEPNARAAARILRASLREGFDWVSAQDPFFAGLLALMVSRVKKIKFNLQVHTDLSVHSWLRRALARALLRRADSVRVVSERIRDQVHATGTKAPVHVLPVYVDLSRFQQIEHIAHDRHMILWIGRFEDEKDPLRAVEVLRQVRAEGVDAVLVMLGAGRLEKALCKAAQGLPVEFPGWRPPEEYLTVADVVLSTSKHESWGASIIEALAAGVPVVAPDVGIAREAGAIVAPRASLARAILETLKAKPVARLQLAFLDKEEWGKRWRETLA